VCDDVLSELIKIRQNLKNKFGDTQMPLFLMGASFGGALTTRCSQLISESEELSQKIQLSGCILLAPALQVNSSSLNVIKKMLMPLSSFISLVLPHIRMAQEVRVCA
jgi:alpha-beta hydrolase superfamily lysophospholipase